MLFISRSLYSDIVVVKIVTIYENAYFETIKFLFRYS